jgi:hypothetical protein
MPEAQLKRLRTKRRNSILLTIGGVGLMLCAFAFMIWYLRQGSDILWILWMFMMVVGIMSTFAGLDTLVFDYRTFEERLEEL